MKILMLVSSMHAGGAERVAATLVNAWAERGDSVILTPTYSSKGSCFYPLSDKVELVWLADLAGTRASGAMAGSGTFAVSSPLSALQMQARSAPKATSDVESAENRSGPLQPA